jgi:hypothetical protein
MRASFGVITTQQLALLVQITLFQKTGSWERSDITFLQRFHPAEDITRLLREAGLAAYTSVMQSRTRNGRLLRRGEGSLRGREVAKMENYVERPLKGRHRVARAKTPTTLHRVCSFRCSISRTRWSRPLFSRTLILFGSVPYSTGHCRPSTLYTTPRL